MENFKCEKSHNFIVIAIEVQMVIYIGCPINMLKIRNKIECYDKIMDLFPNYPKMWYNLDLGFKKAKKYVHRSEIINKLRKSIKWKIKKMKRQTDLQTLFWNFSHYNLKRIKFRVINYKQLFLMKIFISYPFVV